MVTQRLLTMSKNVYVPSHYWYFDTQVTASDYIVHACPQQCQQPNVVA